MKRFIPLILLVGTTLFTSCVTDVVYSHFFSFSSEEWSADSVIRFDYRIDNPDADYRIIVYVHHTERYPYQNMWLFIRNSLQRDTIEFYLADDRGQWLGDTHNGFIEMPVLLDENRHYADTGAYFIEVQHAMRDTLLRGVADIGLEIIRNGQE